MSMKSRRVSGGTAVHSHHNIECKTLVAYEVIERIIKLNQNKILQQQEQAVAEREIKMVVCIGL